MVFFVNARRKGLERSRGKLNAQLFKGREPLKNHFWVDGLLICMEGVALLQAGDGEQGSGN